MSSRESLKQMPLKGRLDTHVVHLPEEGCQERSSSKYYQLDTQEMQCLVGSRQNRCPSERLDTHVVHLPEEGRHERSFSEYYQVRHPHSAPSRRRLSRMNSLLNIIKLDIHAVHLIEEGHQERSSSEYYQVRHPRGASVKNY